VELDLRASPGVAQEAVARLEKELADYLAAKSPRPARP
jgi:hypothetical protein